MSKVYFRLQAQQCVVPSTNLFIRHVLKPKGSLPELVSMDRQKIIPQPLIVVNIFPPVYPIIIIDEMHDSCTLIDGLVLID